MKKAPRTGGAGNGYINALNKPYSTPCRTNITPANAHACQGCGIIIQRSTRRPVCPDCWHWHIALTHIKAALDALREVA